MVSTTDEPPVLLEGEAVGHSGQIIGHGAVEAVALRQPGELLRQPVWLADERVERLAEGLLGVAAFGEDCWMAVHLVEEKAFQSRLFFGQLGRRADDGGGLPHVGDAADVAIGEFALGDGQHVAHLPIDHFVDDRPPQLAVVQIRKSPCDAIAGLTP